VKRSGVLIIAALISGVAIGLFLKRTAEQELFGQLESELKAACDCSLVAKTWDVNLLSLTARATNVAVVENGEEKLKFKEILGDFSLKALRDHQVLITNLKLIDGFSKGVSPDTAPFKFIARLAKPLPPEKNYPGRWKLRLLTLDVINTSFKERRDSITLSGTGLTLSMYQDEQTNVTILPKLESFEIASKDLRKRFSLGTLAADIYATDDLATFKKVDLSKGSNGVVISAKSETANNDRLTGEGSFSFDREYLKLPKWFEGNFRGPLILGGSLGNPDLSISNIESSDAPISVQLSKPISIKDGKLSGVIHGTIGDGVFDDVSISGLDATLSLDGKLDEPKIGFKGTVQELSKKGINTGRLSFEGKIEDGIKFAASGEKLFAQGILKSPDNEKEDSYLENLNIKTNALQTWKDAFVTSELNLSGPVSKLSGTGKFTVENAGTAPLGGEVKMKDGNLSLSLVDSKGTTDLTVETHEAEGTLTLDLRELPLKTFSSSISCGDLSLLGKYSFSTENPLTGSGNIEGFKASLGCSDSPLTISGPQKLLIKDGKIFVSGIEVNSEAKGLNLDGTISTDGSLDLKGEGSLDLASLAGSLTSLDDISGRISVDAGITGSIGAPSIQGLISLDKIGLDIASADLSASGFTGTLDFKENELQVRSLNGEINGGNVELKGALNPFDLSSSSLEMSFEDVQIEPAPSAFLVIDGAISLSHLASPVTTLSGDLNIESGEYQKNIDIMSVIKSLTQFLLQKSPTTLAPSNSNINLDLRVKGDHDIFVLTNWLGAELQGDIEVKGTLSSPNFSGLISAVSGWFGFRNKRFEVNTAEIHFYPDKPEPELYLLGETTVRPPSGELATILLQANGPISRPRVELFSDQGLTQREMILLITGGKVSSDSTLANAVGVSLQGDTSSSLMDEIPFLPGPLHGLLRLITRVDSLDIEPRVDPRTGENIPYATATKNLSRRLWLVGESALSGTGKEHSARAVFSLLPYLNISGGIESSVVSDSAALSADATLTLLSRRKRLTKYVFKGDFSKDEDDLRADLRLNESVPQSLTSLGRREKDILKIFHNLGYLSAAVSTVCDEQDKDLCKKVIFNINEGPRFKVTSISYAGDDPLPVIKSLPTIVRPVDATKEFLDDIQKEILSSLRNEGYLSSRVNTNYSIINGSESFATIEIKLGRPVTFVFIGNKEFTNEEFFETIKLFDRKQPFGVNTISILTENIERLYRENGFLLTTIRSERIENAESNRITYRVYIEEGPRISVGKVVLVGASELSENKIRKGFEKLGEDIYRRMFLPSYVLDEEIAANINVLLGLYDEDGFYGTSITQEIQLLEESNQAQVSYKISEGQKEKKHWLEITNVPADVTLQQLPKDTYSRATANKYLESAIEALRSAAYNTASLHTSYDQTRDIYVVKINPGEKTIVNDIKIEGNSSISSEVIEDTLLIRKGAAWSSDKIQKSQLALLKLGAFSRVEVIPADNIVDSSKETLLVRVVERPLNTLEVGGGANSELGIHAFGEATDLSLFKDGKSLTLRLDGYYDPTEGDISEGVGSIRFTYPSFLRSNLNLSEEVRFQRQELSSLPFDLDRMSLGSTLYESSEDFTYSFGHTIFQENLNNVAPDAILSSLDNGIVTLSSIGGSLRWDYRDAPLLPTKGYLLGIESKLSSESLASDANYAGVSGTASHFLPFRLFERQVVLATGLRSGVMDAFQGTDEIPISQRYFLGGRTSVRGYRENSLGPRGVDGSVLGGDLFFVGNIELQFRLYEVLSIQPFFDVGNVYLLSDSTDTLKSGAGLGFRYLSPIGPVGVDFGYPLNGTPDGRDVRVTFNIGTTF